MIDTPHDRPPRRALDVRPLMALALAVCLGTSATCRADLVLSVTPVQAAPGTAGAFDLLITNTNPAGGASFDVAGDTLELSLSGPSGVSLTGVTIATVVPYVFVTSGTTQGGGPFSSDAFPNAHFHAADAEFAAAGSRSIAPGQTFGLARVAFAVDAGAAPGLRTISFGPDTSFSDPSGAALSFSVVDGSLGVVASSVPAPSSWLMASLGSCGLLLLGRRRARRP